MVVIFKGSADSYYIRPHFLVFMAKYERKLSSLSIVNALGGQLNKLALLPTKIT